MPEKTFIIKIEAPANAKQVRDDEDLAKRIQVQVRQLAILAFDGGAEWPKVTVEISK